MEPLLHVQGGFDSELTPLVLVHAISGLAMPYLALGDLDPDAAQARRAARPVVGISCPLYADKGYALPRTLDDVARDYLALVRREVRPRGPYLLGGWSMGGMIALRMAALLEADGEQVLHVLMVDSTNPARIPAFHDPAELEKATALTYGGVARRCGLPVTEPGLGGDESSSSSDELDLFDDGDDEDDGLGLREVLPRMRRHVRNGLRLIGNVPPKKSSSVECPVSLIKCTSLARLPPTLSDGRKASIHKNFHDETLGWRLQDMHTIELAAQHDSVFDEAHAGELTTKMADVLSTVAE